MKAWQRIKLSAVWPISLGVQLLVQPLLTSPLLAQQALPAPTLPTINSNISLFSGATIALSRAATAAPPSPSQPSSPTTSPQGTIDAVPQTAKAVYERYISANRGVSVETLITTALQQNAEWLAAEQQLAILQARRLQAKLRPNPRVEAEYLNDKLGTGDGENGFSATYSQPIEVKGKRQKRIQLADLELEQATKTLEFQRQQLISQIRVHYTEAVLAAETIRQVVELQLLNEQVVRLTTVRLNQGDVAKLDVSLLQAETYRLQSEQTQAETRWQLAILQLQTLAVWPLERELLLQPLDLTNRPALPVEAVLVARALQQRTDLQAAQLVTAIATARRTLAIAEATPDVELFARYEQDRSIFDRTAIGDLVDTDRRFAVGFSLPLAIFNRNQGHIAEAEATERQVQYRHEFLAQVIKRDVTLAYRRVQTATQALQLYEQTLLPTMQENVRILRAAYDLGEQTIVNVIAEQRRLLEAAQQYLALQREYQLARLELTRAVGGALQ
jgi:outer membrane protein, heavy metal efflux system